MSEWAVAYKDQGLGHGMYGVVIKDTNEVLFEDLTKEKCEEITRRWNSQPDLLTACENSPTDNMFSIFADFAEECFSKPSMAVYRNKFIGLATFLRSCEDRAQKIEAAIAKAKKGIKRDGTTPPP